MSYSDQAQLPRHDNQEDKGLAGFHWWEKTFAWTRQLTIRTTTFDLQAKKRDVDVHGSRLLVEKSTWWFLLACVTAVLTWQSWIKTMTTNCSEFIGKDEWPPNSLDLYPLDYHVWAAVLDRYKIFHPAPKNTDELKKVLQLILDQLSHDSINKVILSFTKRLQACQKAGVDYWTLRTCFEINWLTDFRICNERWCYLALQITIFLCKFEKMEFNI